MRSALLNAHVQLIGETERGSRWLPFAKGKLRDMLDHASRTGTRTLVRRWRVEQDIDVTVRLSGGEKFIVIDAPLPCSDRRGFLLVRVPGGMDPIYDAYYNDGVIERINPTNGTPRPEPDPAVRTKYYKVPTEIRQAGTGRVTASRFSGLMRMVVGCYHAAGKEAPFSYNWSVTHGVLSGQVVVDNVLTTLYWLIEISSLGVFAAPFTSTGKCCDSWSVARYVPTAEEIEAVPGDVQYRDPVSLWWAHTHGREGVMELVPAANIAPGYAMGSPWFSGHGWAFSASGQAAQNCVARSLSSPADHWRCARLQVTFSVTDSGEVSAAFSVVEDAPATFTHTDIIWAPDGSDWIAVSDFPGAPPLSTFPLQAVAVHVYYEGETAVVSRFSLSSVSKPTEESPPALVLTDASGGTGLIHHGVSRRAILATLQAQEYCQNGSPATPTDVVTQYGLVSPSTTFHISSHTLVTAGFSVPGMNASSLRFTSRSRQTIETIHIGTFPMTLTTFNNTYGLHPDCYFVRPEDPPVLVTTCTSTINLYEEVEDFYDLKMNLVETQIGGSALVLFAAEREAIMLVERVRLQITGSGQYENNARMTGGGQRETKVDFGDCPFTIKIGRPTINPTSGGTVPFLGPSSGALPPDVSSDAASASATLLMPYFQRATQLQLGPAPFFTPENYSLGTFLDYDPATKTRAVSNVIAMHGNMAQLDATLTPPDQRTNAVYRFDAGIVALGGFAEVQGDPTAFVGRA